MVCDVDPGASSYARVHDARKEDRAYPLLAMCTLWRSFLHSSQ